METSTPISALMRMVMQPILLAQINKVNMEQNLNMISATMPTQMVRMCSLPSPMSRSRRAPVPQDGTEALEGLARRTGSGDQGTFHRPQPSQAMWKPILSVFATMLGL